MPRYFSFLFCSFRAAWRSARLGLRLWACHISFLLGGFLLWACNPSPGQSLPQVALQIGPRVVRAELASKPEQHAIGLMYRKSLQEDAAMLFSFPADRMMHFYMKNTLIPLSIAYLDKDGIIREIHQMQPLDQSTVSSRWPMRYALELNQGWFVRHNVAIGTQVTFADGTPLRQK